MTVSVRPATPHDVEPLSHVLARAFRDDPFHRWIFPTEKAWAKNSHRSFATALRGEVHHGTVFTDEQMQGAAVWRDPRLGALSLWEQLRMGLPSMAHLGTRAPLVFLGFQRLMALHPKAPHWYLSILGTEPSRQHQGVGAALLRAALSRCDDAGHSAYLEASRPENVPYYERHGFEVMGEHQLPKGPPVWRMLYPPRS